MGKIRVKSFGDQELEEKDKRRAAKRAEQKEQKKLKDASGQEESQTEEPKEEAQTEPKKLSEAKSASGGAKKKKKAAKEGFRSQNYKEKFEKIDRTRKYHLSEALDLLTSVHMAKFDETVELHINTFSS